MPPRLEAPAYPYPPSFHDAYTNGPVAVALLAQSLGLPALEPSLWADGFMDVHGIFPPGFVPGTNYAFAGATASEYGTIVPGANLPDQVAAYTALVSNSADPSALYVVMIGGNDVILTALSGLSQPAADVALMASVTSEVDQIKTLAEDGADNFLVVNVPNVGLIPFMPEDHPTDAADATADSQCTTASSAWSWRASACPPRAPRFNLYAFNANILDNAASYGFTDTTQPCFNAAPTGAAALGMQHRNRRQFHLLGPHPSDGAVQALWARGFGGHSRAFDLGDVAARVRRNGLCGICKLAKSERGVSGFPASARLRRT